MLFLYCKYTRMFVIFVHCFKKGSSIPFVSSVRSFGIVKLNFGTIISEYSIKILTTF